MARRPEKDLHTASEESDASSGDTAGDPIASGGEAPAPPPPPSESDHVPPREESRAGAGAPPEPPKSRPRGGGSGDGKGSGGGHGPAAPRQRFVISHLLSALPAERRAASREQFDTNLAALILPLVNVEVDNEGRTDDTAGRRVVVVEADPRELAAKMAEMPTDAIAEPELLRAPARAYPAAFLPSANPAGGPGAGAVLALTLRAPNGDAVAAAQVMVRFNGLFNPSLSTVAGGIADANGAVAIAFDPNQWRPTMAVVEPAGRYWSLVADMPQTGQILQLQDLPQTGPLRWWHQLAGLTTYDATLGEGIRVGVIDSGVGPHPSLDHAHPIGAFLDGTFLPGVENGRDVQDHGTHVSGIIGARPPANTQTPCGLAPGADLFVGRVFSTTGGGNQGDIANAIDTLSQTHAVDLINMSLIGAPSAIEHDAVIAAFERGTLCVCAAGNQGGSVVGAPAQYPEAVAISAFGLLNMAPPGSMPAANVPTASDRFGTGGLFLASFSNFGREIYCGAPGNGIISTVPANAGDPAPFADMSGTSMSSPMVTGTLAALLSRHDQYRWVERGRNRAILARAVLSQFCRPIGLSQVYQGLGLARCPETR